ncbi:MAG: DUF1801 domain-containing protein [Taibaiella sp.]|nr:DUF1801 domain-containing protein [Taibaiella sp.]
MITAHTTIDGYIQAQPTHVQHLLQQMREIIRKAAPKAQEVISYGMPAFKGYRVLVYFAAAKEHIGFYPTGSGIEHFKGEFGGYKWSKGAVQFPLNEPLPVKLITRMVKFRLAEDKELETLKASTKNKAVKK